MSHQRIFLMRFVFSKEGKHIFFALYICSIAGVHVNLVLSRLKIRAYIATCIYVYDSSVQDSFQYVSARNKTLYRGDRQRPK
jgi:hypothetical protein